MIRIRLFSIRKILCQLKFQLFINVILSLCFSIILTKILHESDTRSRGNEVAEKLEKEVRVICWVLTNPNNHKTKALHVKRTWGRKCNRLLLMSSKKDDLIGTIGLPNVSEGRNWLWAKTKEAYKYIWEHHRDEAEWFLKTDDDTYVIMENLRKFLLNKSPKEPIFYGCHFHSHELNWVSGGAGFVLSKEALRIFIEVALPDKKRCRTKHDGAADAEMAKCLLNVGVDLGDTRDEFGRHRFLPFLPSDHLYPHEKPMDYWYWKDILYHHQQGMDCCANDAISFHYVRARDMYAFEYFLYHLRPHGINREVRYLQEYPLEFTTSTSKKPTTKKRVTRVVTSTSHTSLANKTILGFSTNLTQEAPNTTGKTQILDNHSPNKTILFSNHTTTDAPTTPNTQIFHNHSPNQTILFSTNKTIILLFSNNTTTNAPTTENTQVLHNNDSPTTT